MQHLKIAVVLALVLGTAGVVFAQQGQPEFAVNAHLDPGEWARIHCHDSEPELQTAEDNAVFVVCGDERAAAPRPTTTTAAVGEQSSFTAGLINPYVHVPLSLRVSSIILALHGGDQFTLNANLDPGEWARIQCQGSEADVRLAWDQALFIICGGIVSPTDVPTATATPTPTATETATATSTPTATETTASEALDFTGGAQP